MSFGLKSSGNAGGAMTPYLRGPIPMQWLKSATEIGGGALPVGIALWHLRALHQSTTFPTSMGRISSLMGISVKRTRTALRKLEGAGLVVIQRRTGARSHFALPSFNPHASAFCDLAEFPFGANPVSINQTSVCGCVIKTDSP